MKCLVFLLLAVAAHGEEVCPWVNTATVSGTVGSPLTEHVSGNACEFSNATESVRIEVIDMTDHRKQFGHYLAQCGSLGIVLRGIGNEAMACEKASFELIVSRVRERAFLVRLTSKERARWLEQARDVAEQVAGSLF